MGQIKITTFAIRYSIKKDQQIYTFGITFRSRGREQHVSMSLLQCIWYSDNILRLLPWKRAAESLKMYATYLPATFFRGTKKYLLTAFLNLPVREKVSMIAEQCTLPQQSKEQPGKYRLKMNECHKLQINGTGHTCKPSLNFLKRNICLLLQIKATVIREVIERL